jgi:hypothetical protein
MRRCHADTEIVNITVEDGATTALSGIGQRYVRAAEEVQHRCRRRLHCRDGTACSSRHGEACSPAVVRSNMLRSRWLKLAESFNNGI